MRDARKFTNDKSIYNLASIYVNNNNTLPNYNNKYIKKSNIYTISNKEKFDDIHYILNFYKCRNIVFNFIITEETNDDMIKAFISWINRYKLKYFITLTPNNNNLLIKNLDVEEI